MKQTRIVLRIQGVEQRVGSQPRVSSGISTGDWFPPYFCLGPVSKAHRGVDAHAQHRLRQWLRAKHKVRGQGFARFPDRVLYQDLGLTRVQGRPRIFPWANA